MFGKNVIIPSGNITGGINQLSTNQPETTNYWQYPATSNYNWGDTTNAGASGGSFSCPVVRNCDLGVAFWTPTRNKF